MDSQKVVTPVKTGVQEICNELKTLDSGPFDKLRVPSLSRDFRRNDGKRRSLTFSETIEDERLQSFCLYR